MLKSTWWRVATVLLLPPISIAVAVAMRYIFQIHSLVIEYVALFVALGAGAALIVKLVPQLVLRWAVLVVYSVISAILSFWIALTVACSGFHDCL